MDGCESFGNPFGTRRIASLLLLLLNPWIMRWCIHLFFRFRFSDGKSQEDSLLLLLLLLFARRRVVAWEMCHSISYFWPLLTAGNLLTLSKQQQSEAAVNPPAIIVRPSGPSSSGGAFYNWNGNLFFSYFQSTAAAAAAAKFASCSSLSWNLWLHRVIAVAVVDTCDVYLFIYLFCAVVMKLFINPPQTLWCVLLVGMH